MPSQFANGRPSLNTAVPASGDGSRLILHFVDSEGLGSMNVVRNGR